MTNPQTTIPLARTADELKAIISTDFKGVVNVLLTIETIEYLLSINKKNRTIKAPSVNAYIQDFERTGYESIALMTIDDSGGFADGQHRLFALLRLMQRGWKSPEIWQLVNVNVSKKRTESIDNGVIRSSTDVLIMNGTVPSLKIARALKTYTLLNYPLLRKASVNLLEEVYENDFNGILELGEFKSVPGQTGGTGGTYDTPLWVIAGFRILQHAYTTDCVKKAYTEFYQGTSLESPMVKFRSLVLANRYAKGKQKIRPWSTDTRSGLAKMFCAAKHCIEGTVMHRLEGTRLGIKIYEREF